MPTGKYEKPLTSYFSRDTPAGEKASQSSSRRKSKGKSTEADLPPRNRGTADVKLKGQQQSKQLSKTSRVIDLTQSNHTDATPTISGRPKGRKRGQEPMTPPPTAMPSEKKRKMTDMREISMVTVSHGIPPTPASLTRPQSTFAPETEVQGSPRLLPPQFSSSDAATSVHDKYEDFEVPETPQQSPIRPRKIRSASEVPTSQSHEADFLIPPAPPPKHLTSPVLSVVTLESRSRMNCSMDEDIPSSQSQELPLDAVFGGNAPSSIAVPTPPEVVPSSQSQSEQEVETNLDNEGWLGSLNTIIKS